MRVTAFFLLPALVFSFNPQQSIRTVPRSNLRFASSSATLTGNAVDDLSSDVASKTEAVVEKADSWILKRVMSAANHAPAVYTLKQFATAAGSSKLGVDAAASAFSYSAPALLALPTWLNNVWRVACVFQIASLTKSVFKVDKDDISQGDISALAASNFAATKALSSGSLQWLVATSILSSYSARSGGGSELTVHNTGTQLVSSFTTAVAILGVAAAIPNIVPLLAGQEEILAAVGLAGTYVSTTRSGNGTVKKAVNGLVIGGILWAKIAGGALNGDNLLKFGTIITAGAAYVAFEAFKRAKDALNE
jgi:hypothetical protein